MSRGRTLVADHDFQPVAGHPDDDECTYRSDGTDATYCGQTRAWHSVVCNDYDYPDWVEDQRLDHALRKRPVGERDQPGCECQYYDGRYSCDDENCQSRVGERDQP